MSTRQETGTATAHRVVILGAGYAGMVAAVQLAARTKRRRAWRWPCERTGGFAERMRMRVRSMWSRRSDTVSEQCRPGCFLHRCWSHSPAEFSNPTGSAAGPERPPSGQGGPTSAAHKRSDTVNLFALLRRSKMR
ncbi:hypothetical protein B1H19_33160 [Streptomyces gilvosporeus]|uniref:FAD/NAD(P)-binding domain-containing protein n=1 Tax=Streptomyces gilvosporeus TaxID=553510 RepID=A0A1V0TZQ5_9ACTN|nr:hypothetical protein B1H19_33160 [Streptomyces gilvosporeus]